MIYYFRKRYGDFLNKLEFLLDGTTIINFPFFAKLFKRYLKSSLLLLSLIFLGSISFYAFQESYYWTSISFTDATVDNSNSSGKNIMGLLGEKKGGIRSTDILNLRSSIDFNRKIAEILIKSEFFKQMRFDLEILGKESGKAILIEKACAFDRQCIVANLAKRLPAFYQISDKDRSGVNFIIEVKSLNALTSNVILKAIEQSILDARKEVVRISMENQEKINTRILIEKKKQTDILDFYERLEERDRLESELKEVQSQLDHQTNVITSVQDNLTNAEATFMRSKKISGQKVNYDEVDDELRKKELREKIKKLNSDMAALEDVSTPQSEQGKEFIQQLKREIADAKSKFSKFKKKDSQAGLNEFIKENDEKLHSKELEYKIASDQLEQAKEIYETLNLKRKDVLGRKIKAEQNIEILKPSIEFIKELEIKIEHLKLTGAMAGADVRFDNYSATPEAVKKIGLILMVAYTLILQGLMLIFYLGLRFFMDKYVHDIEDLKYIDSNFKILGDGPEYE